jgi:hypothetical protein
MKGKSVRWRTLALVNPAVPEVNCLQQFPAMSGKSGLVASPPTRLAAWQSAYEAALQATDTNTLFKLVEIAEAAVLVRRDLLAGSSRHRTERCALEEALRTLTQIKETQLRFPSDGARRLPAEVPLVY